MSSKSRAFATVVKLYSTGDIIYMRSGVGESVQAPSLTFIQSVACILSSELIFALRASLLQRPPY